MLSDLYYDSKYVRDDSFGAMGFAIRFKMSDCNFDPHHVQSEFDEIWIILTIAKDGNVAAWLYCISNNKHNFVIFNQLIYQEI